MDIKPYLPSKKNWYLWAFGGLVVIGGVYYFRGRSSAAPVDNATDPYANSYADDSYTDSGYSGIDSTGYGPGVPSSYGYYDPGTGQFIGNGTGTSTVTAPSTNAAWAQQAIAYLVNIGYDPAATSAAIGKYLLNANLTADEMKIVQAAIGVEGMPPGGAQPPHTAPPAGNTGGNTTKAPPPGPYSWRATGPAFNTVIKNGKPTKVRITINSVAGIASHWGITRETVLRYNPTWQGKYNLGALPIGIPIRLPAGVATHPAH